MEPWQQRLVQERDDLPDRVTRLEQSLIEYPERDPLLRVQLPAMLAYLAVLELRVATARKTP